MPMLPFLHIFVGKSVIETELGRKRCMFPMDYIRNYW